MKKISKKIATVIIICFAVGTVLGIRFFSTANKQQISVAGDRRKGPDNAPLKIIEFMDFQCPACAVGAKYLKKFMAENPSVVQLEMKYFPLKGHKHGLLSAQYAQCAAMQGKFWPFHDYLIERQNQWRRLPDARPAFDVIAKDLQLDEERLRQCLSDEETTRIIMETKKEGQALGVKSTPTYFINGEMVIGTKVLKTTLEKFRR